MEGRILVAGLDGRELRLEVRFLERDPDRVQDVGSGGELFDAVAKDGASLVVLGPRLPGLPMVEAIRRLREEKAGPSPSIWPASRRTSPPKIYACAATRRRST